MPPNLLRQPKPTRDAVLYTGRFYPGSEDASLDGSFGFSIVLGREYLWLSGELSVPLWAIRSAEIFEVGWFPKRRGLRIVYENPLSGQPESIVLLKLNALGFHRIEPLQELRQELEAARAAASRSAATDVSGPVVSAAHLEPVDACEVCGEKPAEYVSYTYLISLLVFSFRGADKRRMHCRKHNLMYGLGHYLVTVVTGWFGIGILSYPGVVFRTARSLELSVGRPATYALAVAPLVAVAALLLRIFEVI